MITSHISDTRTNDSRMMHCYCHFIFIQYKCKLCTRAQSVLLALKHDVLRPISLCLLMGECNCYSLLFSCISSRPKAKTICFRKYVYMIFSFFFLVQKKHTHKIWPPVLETPCIKTCTLCVCVLFFFNE